MTFDWTISLGQVVQVLLLLFGGGMAAQRFYYALDKRVSTVEREIVSHASALEREIANHAHTLDVHGGRMERWEGTLFKLVGDLQRVVGNIESAQRWKGDERRVDQRG